MFVVAVKYQTIGEPSIWFYRDGWDAFESFMSYARSQYPVSVRHTDNFNIASFSEKNGLTIGII